MSNRQTGNKRENIFGALLEALGFVAFYSRGSRGVDILAIHAEGLRPHLLIAVARPSMSAISSTFKELYAHPAIAGSYVLLARAAKTNNKSWWIYTDPDTRFSTLDLALEELQKG